MSAGATSTALRRQWRGPLVIKGLLHPDDAREAISRGADGIIVSNHGGRQLDGAVATIRALPGVVEAVGGRAPVLIDGGFRRGVDVVKALALGARAILIGRPHLWGVACAGEDGVFWVLDLFRREIDRALALGGWDGVAKLDPSIFFAADRRHRAGARRPRRLVVHPGADSADTRRLPCRAPSSRSPSNSAAPEAGLKLMPPLHSATSPIMRALATLKTSLSPGFMKDA